MIFLQFINNQNVAFLGGFGESARLRGDSYRIRNMLKYFLHGGVVAISAEGVSADCLLVSHKRFLLRVQYCIGVLFYKSVSVDNGQLIFTEQYFISMRVISVGDVCCPSITS